MSDTTIDDPTFLYAWATPDLTPVAPEQSPYRMFYGGFGLFEALAWREANPDPADLVMVRYEYTRYEQTVAPFDWSTADHVVFALNHYVSHVRSLVHEYALDDSDLIEDRAFLEILEEATGKKATRTIRGI